MQKYKYVDIGLINGEIVIRHQSSDEYYSLH